MATPQSFSKNTAPTTLAANITNAATQLNVASAATFPTTNNFTILIGSEFMLVTGGATTTTWTVTRHTEGSTAAPHNVNDPVTHVWTKAGLDSWGDGYWATLRPSGWTNPVNAQLFGAGGAIIGTPPNMSGHFLFQAGTNIVITNPNGAFTINFPSHFPPRMLTVQMTMGDNVVGPSGVPDVTLTCLQPGMSTSAISGAAYQSHTGVGLVSQQIRVGWFAVGW